jgi:hypothetical protein
MTPLPDVFALGAWAEQRYAHLASHAAQGVSGDQVVEQIKYAWPARLRVVLDWRQSDGSLAWILESASFRVLFGGARLKVISGACCDRKRHCSTKCTRPARPDRPTLRSAHRFTRAGRDRTILYSSFSTPSQTQAFLAAELPGLTGRVLPIECNEPTYAEPNAEGLSRSVTVAVRLGDDLLDVRVALTREEQIAFRDDRAAFLASHSVRFNPRPNGGWRAAIVPTRS